MQAHFPAKDRYEERPFRFACPLCHGVLTQTAPDTLFCDKDQTTYAYEGGIWHFLPPDKARELNQFQREYETVRRREGRSSTNPAYFQVLPFLDKAVSTEVADSLAASHDNESSASGWKVRAQSFLVLLEKVIIPLEREKKRSLRILDLGAGNCWLSNRLALRGHSLAAVDLGSNDWDGLGAQRHFSSSFTCLQASFDHLPLEADQADLIIYNASLHYSVGYGSTLQEALRVLRPDGLIVVMDTAVYRQQASGRQMVAEREAAFREKYGFASKALPLENFLTVDRLNQLAKTLRVNCHQLETVPKWRQKVRWAKVLIRRQREPAQFPLLIFTPDEKLKLGGNRLSRNSLWLFLARVGQQALMLLFTVLVARQLGDVGLGQLAWVTAVLYVGNVFSTFGLDTWLLRQIAAKRRADTVPLAAALVLELFLAALFIAALWLVPLSAYSSETVAGLRLYGWALLPLALLTLTSAALRAHEEMGLFAFLTLGTAVVQLAGTAVLFLAGGGFVALMAWLVGVQIISAAAGWRLCRTRLPNFGLSWGLLSGKAVRQLARAGFWLALLMVVSVLLQRLGIIVVGRLGSQAQTGQLAAGLRLVEAARLFPGAVMGAVFPLLARQADVSFSSHRQRYNRLSRLSGMNGGLLLYGILASAALTLLAKPLVMLLFGPGYDTAVSLLRLLAWGVIPFTLSLPLSVRLVAMEQERRVLLVTFLVLVITAVFATTAFSQGGLNGLTLVLVSGEWLLLLLLVTFNPKPTNRMIPDTDEANR